MGERNTEIRVWGARAASALQQLLAVADAEVSVRDGWLCFTRDDEQWALDRLETREDGVVVMYLQNCDIALCLRHPDWVVRVHSSCSKGIDFEVLRIWQGETELLDVTQMPDGELTVKVKGEVMQQANVDSDVTWRELVDRWAPTLAATLGPGHVVLSERDTGTSHRFEPPAQPTREDDDVPF